MLSKSPAKSQPASTQLVDSLLWVDKYKPTKLSDVIGQQGEKSNMNKLLKWLKSWHKNHLGAAPKKAAWGKFMD